MALGFRALHFFQNSLFSFPFYLYTHIYIYIDTQNNFHIIFLIKKIFRVIKSSLFFVKFSTLNQMKRSREQTTRYLTQTQVSAKSNKKKTDEGCTKTWKQLSHAYPTHLLFFFFFCCIFRILIFAGIRYHNDFPFGRSAILAFGTIFFYDFLFFCSSRSRSDFMSLSKEIWDASTVAEKNLR